MKLYRVAQSERGTFGALVIDHLPFCVTMELPWRDNRNSLSCIPAGKYKWKKHNSPSKGPVIWIQDVPGRSWIYFHVANWPSNVLGCIGVGLRYGRSGTGEYGVLDSAVAMSGLLKRLPANGEIEIINP